MKTLKRIIILVFCVCMTVPIVLAAKTDSDYLKELNPHISTNKVELKIPNKSKQCIYLYVEEKAELQIGWDDYIDAEIGDYKNGRYPIYIYALKSGKTKLEIEIHGNETDEEGFDIAIWSTAVTVNVKKNNNKVVGYWNAVNDDDIECSTSMSDQYIYRYSEQYELSDGRRYQFSSDNKNVKISKEGNITIKKNFCGAAKVTIKSNHNVWIGKKKTTISIVVTPARVKIGEPSSPKKEIIATKIKLVPGATGYQVFIGKSLGDSGDLKWKSKENTKVFINKNQVKNGQIRLHNKKGGKKHIVSGKWYHLKVRAYKTVKGKKIFGEWSDEWAIRVK